MNVSKSQLLNILNDISPILIFRGKRKIKHNKKTIDYNTIFNVISKELLFLVEEMPNFLDYEIRGFQEAAERGEFTFPEYYSIEECILVYFKDMKKCLGLITT